MDSEAVTNSQLQVDQLANAPIAPIPAPTATVPETSPDAGIKPRSNFRITLIIIALCCSVFIGALNTTITATAVPTICADLKSASGYAWIGGAFLLGTTVSMPIWVKLSDIWGRKPVLLTAVGIYFVASFICGLSHNMAMLIAGRGLQGIASGGTAQLVNITISDLFSLRRRALFFAATQISWAFAAALGPLLGGAFAQFVSWRWIFWVSLPISGTSFILLLLFLDVHDPKTKVLDGIKAIDWFGCISFLACMLMFLIGLDFGGTIFPWTSAKIICLIVIGSLMSLIFIFGELRIAKYPILPMRLFKNKAVVASMLVCAFQEYAVLTMDFYLPLFFQSALAASPLLSGAYLLPLNFMESAMAFFSGIIINRSGRYREMIIIATILMSIGCGLLITLDAGSSIGKVIAIQIVAGIGPGLLFLPPIIAVQAQVTQEDTAVSTGLLGFLRNMSTSMAVIIGGVIFQNGMEHQTNKLRMAGLPTSITDELTGDNAAANVGLVKTISNPNEKLAVKQAFATSLRNIWIVITVIAVLSVVASLFIQKKNLSSEHTETRTGIKAEKKDAAATVELQTLSREETAPA